jgi:hypothetical protein
MPDESVPQLSRMTERQQIAYLMQLTAAETTAPVARQALKPLTVNAATTSENAKESKATKKSKPKPASETRVELLTLSASICESQLIMLADGATRLRMVQGCSARDGGACEDVLAQLAAFKRIADDLLPAMRRDAHLHHLIFSRHGYSLLLLHTPQSAGEEEEVVGGATFRVLRVDDTLVLDVLVLVVEQRASICRRGLGTALVERLSELIAKEASARGVTRWHLLTQSDNGDKASAFWRKQGLQSGALSDKLLARMHDALPKLVGVYEASTPMVVTHVARNDAGHESHRRCTEQRITATAPPTTTLPQTELELEMELAKLTL